MPMMIKPLFHRQWHAVFAVTELNVDQDDLLSGSIGDDMGLGMVVISVSKDLGWANAQ